MDISKVGNEGGDEKSSSEYGSMPGFCGQSNEMPIPFKSRELMSCLANIIHLI